MGWDGVCVLSNMARPAPSEQPPSPRPNQPGPPPSPRGCSDPKTLRAAPHLADGLDELFERVAVKQLRLDLGVGRGIPVVGVGWGGVGGRVGAIGC
jgi:hypothetical protein